MEDCLSSMRTVWEIIAAICFRFTLVGMSVVAVVGYCIDHACSQELNGRSFFVSSGLVIGKEVVNNRKIESILKSLKKTHLNRHSYGGVVKSTEFSTTDNFDGSFEDLDWKYSSSSLKSYYIQGRQLNGYGTTLGKLPEGGNWRYTQISFDERDVPEGAIVRVGSSPVKTRDEFLRIHRKLKKFDTEALAAAQNELESSVQFQDFENAKQRIGFHFFPWTGVLQFSDRPCSVGFSADTVKSCFKASLGGVSCFALELSNKDGDFHVAFCPTKENMMVAFKICKVGLSAHKGKQLKDFGLESLVYTMHVPKFADELTNDQSHHCESFVKLKPVTSQAIITKTISQYPEFATTIPQAMLRPSMEIPNGTKVYHPSKSQIRWSWKDGAIQKSFDKEIVERMRRSKFTSPFEHSMFILREKFFFCVCIFSLLLLGFGAARQKLET